MWNCCLTDKKYSVGIEYLQMYTVQKKNRYIILITCNCNDKSLFDLKFLMSYLVYLDFDKSERKTFTTYYSKFLTRIKIKQYISLK